MTTKTKIKPITKATVQKELRRIKRENPDAVNPTNEYGSCLYHQGRGRNIKRCIIGQLGWELGLPTPMAELGGVDDLAHPEYGGPWVGRFTESAMNYMTDVQAQADGPSGENPLPWGQVKL